MNNESLCQDRLLWAPGHIFINPPIYAIISPNPQEIHSETLLWMSWIVQNPMDITFFLHISILHIPTCLQSSLIYAPDIKWTLIIKQNSHKSTMNIAWIQSLPLSKHLRVPYSPYTEWREWRVWCKCCEVCPLTWTPRYQETCSGDHNGYQGLGNGDSVGVLDTE